MRSLMQHILAYVMIFVVVISTASFTINMHYCRGNLIEVSAFNHIKSCCSDSSQPLSTDYSISNKNCCQNQQLVVDGQTGLQFQGENISFIHNVFVASLVHTYIFYSKPSLDNKTPYIEPSPHIPFGELYKINESFII